MKFSNSTGDVYWTFFSFLRKGNFQEVSRFSPGKTNFFRFPPPSLPALPCVENFLSFSALRPLRDSGPDISRNPDHWDSQTKNSFFLRVRILRIFYIFLILFSHFPAIPAVFSFYPGCFLLEALPSNLDARFDLFFFPRQEAYFRPDFFKTYGLSLDPGSSARSVVKCPKIFFPPLGVSNSTLAHEIPFSWPVR